MRTYFWDRYRIRSRAKKDAKLNIPPVEYDGKEGRISFTEQGLENGCNRDINQLVKVWKDNENEILRDMDTFSSSVKGCIKRYSEKLKEYKAKYGPDAGPDPKTGHSFWTWLFIILCLIIEASLNAAAFRMLRDSALNTWMIALSLSISITFLAHYWGKLVKSRDKVLFETISTIGIPIVAIVIAYFVGIARMNSAISRGIDPASIKVSFAIFIIVNLVAFLMTVYTSYKHSPIFPRLQQPYNEFKRRRRQFHNRIQSLQKSLNETISGINDKIMTAEFYRQEYQRNNQLVRTANGVDSPKHFSSNESWKVNAKIPEELKKYMYLTSPTQSYMKDLEASHKEMTECKASLGKVEG